MIDGEDDDDAPNFPLGSIFTVDSMLAWCQYAKAKGYGTSELHIYIAPGEYNCTSFLQLPIPHKDNNFRWTHTECSDWVEGVHEWDFILDSELSHISD